MDKNFKYINLSYIKEISEGNNKLIFEIFEIFKSQIPEFINEMNKFLKNQDWKSLGMVAHKAKTSVAIMGMEELSVDMTELEKFARKGINTDIYYKTIEKFTRICNEAIIELNSISCI